MSNATKIKFESYDGHDMKFFYDKADESKELGVITKIWGAVTADVFINGAWSAKLNLGRFANTADAQKAVKAFFSDTEARKKALSEFITKWESVLKV